MVRTQAHRAGLVLSAASLCLMGVFVPTLSPAQVPDGVVAITAEPEHKIRFDNGRVRMYEVVLPKGKATLYHEHRFDSFSVIFRDTEISNESQGGKPVAFNVPAGRVVFASTAEGPYSHRVVATGDSTFHVIAMELMSPPRTAALPTPRPDSMFKVTLENPRGRVYRLTLAPGESTEAFSRRAETGVFAIGAGRISESANGKATRLWDFESGHFRWIETSEKLSIRNDGPGPIDLVEIEVF